ncbi:MAG TPA: CAP domain-containing protein [Candidatus Acidoferrales bacterium]|nr:CAP domain-containing protein [Candidatus Acidoferrales bacterium]
MLRALVLSFAMLTVGLGPCTAQTKSPTADIHNDADSGVGSQLPTAKSISAAGAASTSNEDSAAEDELLQAANKSRELAGVPPLRMEESLREAARAHARRMVASERLEHRLPGEPSLLERIAQVSPVKMDRAGENIANASCALGAHDVLMRSAPHRENLLDRGFNIAGVAAIWSKGRLYVVQDFAHEVPTYSAEQSGKLVGHAVDEMRQQAGLPQLVQLTPPNLDEAACSLARENRPNAHLLSAAYDNRKIITYTESRPEVLPPGALRLLRDPGVRQFAVGSCYARNAAYPTGMYWVAILLY